MTRRLAAPGKLFLAGEYAVLEPGREALVAAVDLPLELSLRGAGISSGAAGQLAQTAAVELWHRPSGTALRGVVSGEPRAPVAWTSGIPAALRFAARATELALRLCAEEGLAPRGFHAVFENDLALPFQLGGAGFTKPGLGGSAAASVLAVRAAALAQERALSPHEMLALAAAAHWIEQGGSGSGADVAASSLGGALAVKLARALPAAEELWAAPARALLASPLVAARPLDLPAGLRLLAVWSGASADTRVLVREVRAFAAARAHLFRARTERIAACTASLEAALGAAARDPSSPLREAVLAAVRDAAAAMAALGEAAACPIVTPALAEICALASAAGCAGKPSGAGGGDCALVFAFGDDARARARELLRARGFASAAVGVAGALR